MYYYNYLLYKE